MHLFFAHDLERGSASPADDEELEVIRWNVGELESRLGELEDAKTLAGVLLYLHERRSDARA
jgi:hypothetical protein